MSADAEHLADMAAEIDVVLAAWQTDGRSLLADRLRRRGVLYALQVIGEASKRLAPDTLAAAPEVPWQRLRGLRNRIVHEYDVIDDALIVGIVEKDLPALQTAIRQLLR